ncbi:MAG: GntR family transcriptional regulator [Microbacteriaceae bacterium]
MTPADPTKTLRSPVQLRVQLADQLRQRIRESEWAVGEKLPTESEFASTYGVSRSTVRAALQQLENQGLTVTRHGLGTFIGPFSRSIKSGLQELNSMSETVIAHGMTPGMRFRSAEIRGATPEEAEALALGPDARVLATQRSILADGEAVAFSFDAIPAELLPNDLDASAVNGSLFALLEENGAVPRTAVADIHAANGASIALPDVDASTQFLMLEQTHYDASARPILFSKTYFLEGRFEFSILRTR